jgi:hAT family C-terminal dimerisation region
VYDLLPSDESGTRGLEAEVDTYLAVPNRAEVDTTISFWEVCYIFNLINACLYDLQDNQDTFPTIFKFAMDILPIQASSVPCERVFSSSKETITARRNSLSPRLVEALQLLKYATKKNRGMSFIDGLDKVEELEELELMEQGKPVEDLEAFLDDF